MKAFNPKPCAVCGQIYIPRGACSKYCSLACHGTVWTRERKSKITYDSLVRRGVIKQPGVGTGHGQGLGPTHHSFKKDAWHRYRDYRKDACERCGSVRFLCVHHKDHDSQNNDPKNFETLCKSCHQKEHRSHLNFNQKESQ